MLLLLGTLLASATPPDPKPVWSSDGQRVYAHCLMDDGRWAGLTAEGLYRGPDMAPLEQRFGKVETVVVGACDTIAYAKDRERQVHLLDPWTGEVRDVDTGMQFVQMVVAPDGRYLVIGGWDDGDQIAIVDVGAGTARRLDGPVSHASWSFSGDGTLFRYAKKWKSPKLVIRDVDTLDKRKDDEVADVGFIDATHPSTHDAWTDHWLLTDDIAVFTDELGTMRVGSNTKRSQRFPMAVHRIQPLPDESLLIFRQQSTRTLGISADIFVLGQARPHLLRWYLALD